MKVPGSTTNSKKDV